MSREKFLTEVRKHACIYDRTSNAHKDKDKRKAAWQKIAAAMVGKEWTKMTTKQREAKVKSLKSKWQMLNRKKAKHAETSTPAASSKNGNILNYFKKTNSRKTSNFKDIQQHTKTDTIHSAAKEEIEQQHGGK